MTRKTAVGAFLVTALLSGGTYLLTLAPDLTWAHGGGDGGELITAAVTLGVPHPPGYPTYILLGKLFSFLPLGSVAYRFNLFSAVCVAIAAGFVTLSSMQLLAQFHIGRSPFLPMSSIATGLCFAFSQLVWNQAIITEVYGLQLALVAACLWTLLSQQPVVVTGLLFGLSITGHLTSFFLAPILLLILPTREWRLLVGGTLIGLSPFLALPFLAQGSSPVVWGTADTWAGWWWVVSGRIYHANAFAWPWSQVWPRLSQWGVFIFSQFTWAGFLLLWLGGQQLRQVENWRLLPAGLATSATLFIIYAFGYNTPDAAVLLLPSFILLALLLAPALHQLRPWGLILPIALLLLNFQGQNLRQGMSLRTEALALLAAAPAEAIFVTSGDASIFALWYFQHVEHQRQDVILVDSQLFGFDWYRQRLAQTYPQLRQLVFDDLNEFILQNESTHTVKFVTLPDELLVPPSSK